MATDAMTNDPPFFVPVECVPDVENLVTEDDTPVDGLLSEKQMRLLVESLLSSWPGPSDGSPFVAMANVGLFYSRSKPAIVPDVLVSLNVQLPANIVPKKSRSYFIWEYGKQPDIVVEVVSNNEGGEDTAKLDLYASIGIRYYIIFDPEFCLGGDLLRVFRLQGAKLKPMQKPYRFDDLELGIELWQGNFESVDRTWLRWVDSRGVIVPTGNERANRLAEQLRKLGINPDV